LFLCYHCINANTGNPFVDNSNTKLIAELQGILVELTMNKESILNSIDSYVFASARELAAQQGQIRPNQVINQQTTLTKSNPTHARDKKKKISKMRDVQTIQMVGDGNNVTAKGAIHPHQTRCCC